MNGSIFAIKKQLESTQDQFWNIDKTAGELLQALVFTHRPTNILEIGTSNGYSAILMAEIASQYGGHITSIEFHEKRIILAKENLEKAGLSNYVTILQGDALEVLADFSPSYEGEREGVDAERVRIVETSTLTTPTPPVGGGPPYPRGRNTRFDFFFIDANKKQYGDYFKECMRLATTNAIIVADNTISHRHSLDSFFKTLENTANIEFLELEIGMGLVIIKV